MSPLIIVLVIAAIIFFGLGAFVEGLMWLVVIGLIALAVAFAMGMGSSRRRI
jgi:hypothetical protein